MEISPVVITISIVKDLVLIIAAIPGAISGYTKIIDWWRRRKLEPACVSSDPPPRKRILGAQDRLRPR